MKKAWTKSDEQYLRDNFQSLSHPEMAAALGRTTIAIKCRCQKLNLIVTNAERGNRAAQGRKALRINEDNAFDAFVAANYLTMPLKTMGKAMGFSYTKVAASLKRQGLKVPDELTEERRGIGAFKNGSTPPNKGKKQAEYMIAEAIEKTKASRFQQGHRPFNAVTVGTEVIIEGYTKVKVGEPNQWVFKQVLVYEAHHGKLPKGKIVVFADKNRQNFDIENLLAISRGEHARRNHDVEKTSAYSRELRDTYVAGVLRRKTGIKNEDIPQYLIELKRAELSVKRELNNIKKSNKKSKNGKSESESISTDA